MRFHNEIISLCVALALFVVMSPDHSQAQDDQQNTGYSAELDTNFWDSDTFRAASGTLLMAAPDELSDDTTEWNGLELEVNGMIVGEDLTVEPDLDNRLFNGTRTVEKEFGPAQKPEAFGTSGAHYSSSGLYHVYSRFSYPFRTIGKLYYSAHGVPKTCTATVIQKSIILTAGHCVHSGNGRNDGYFSDFIFVPAYDAGGAPFGKWRGVRAWVTDEWYSGGGSVPNPADFGMIQIAPQAFDGEIKKISEVTDGYLGYSTVLHPNHTKKLGYPDNIENGERLHQVDGQSHTRTDHSAVLFGSDMLDGSSGGPIIENFGNGISDRRNAENATPNQIVGVISFTGPFQGQKIQGSSQIGETFIKLLNTACSAANDC